MTSLLSAEDKAKVGAISRIELPSDLLAEIGDIDAHSLGQEMSLAVNTTRDSQALLTKAETVKWYQFWRRGEKDEAIIASLKSMQEYQQVTAKIGAYNLWLSHKILGTEEVLKKQNDRIEAAQHEIEDKVSEVDAMLAKFRREITQLSDEMLRYLCDAEQEREKLAASSVLSKQLLDDYAEQAESIRDYLGRIAELAQTRRDLQRHVGETSAALQAQSGAVGALEKQRHAEETSAALQAQSGAVGALEKRMAADSHEIATKITALQGGLQRHAEETSAALQAQSGAVDTLAKRMVADSREVSAKIAALRGGLERVGGWAQQFGRATQSKLKAVDAAAAENALALNTRLDAVQSQLDSDSRRRFKKLAWTVGISLGLSLLACAGAISSMWFLIATDTELASKLGILFSSFSTPSK